MKKLLLVLTLGLAITRPIPVKADSIIHHTMATAYSITGKTATGTYTRDNYTVASKPEWFGSAMLIWFDDGDGIIKPENFIGTFSVEDTGGETIKSGKVIDVYISDYNRAVEFGSKKVIVQVIPAEG